MEITEEVLAHSKVQAWLYGGDEIGDLPSRFEATGDGKNSVIIKDTETGRQAVVPVFAWPAVRRVLDNLFEE